ncbi:MAG: peptide ABC transporter substrate-binding protein [bacterium]
MGSKRIWLVLALVVVLAMAATAVGACGDDDTGATTPGGGKAVEGGIFNFYINEPAFIDPVNGQESEGIQVINSVFDSLVAFDPLTSALLPAAAESWEANADASVWTFKLADQKFHNGRDVTAADFKYAWERICNPVNEGEIAYHLAAVKGFEAMQDGTAMELEGVKAIDDKTLEVTLQYPFGDFEYVVGHASLGPVPKEEVDKDPAAFADMPIGNGPFKMAGPWQHDQLIQVVRFDDYYGQKAYLDGVDFKIFKDEETAFLEFKAGNLDFTYIPSGQVVASKAEYGDSADGWTVEPGKQVLTGAEIATYYCVFNVEDEVLANADLRRAISLAINRQAIVDTVYEGVRKPATGIVPPGIAGFLPDQWPYSKYDVEQAKQMLEKAGYPGGEGLPELRVGFNTGVGHEDVFALVQADLKAIGINTKLEGVEWAQWLDQMDAKDFQLGRLGWSSDYPIMDNWIAPLFQSDSLDNHSFYGNPVVDQGILDARQIVDTDTRIAKYQEMERTIGEDAPVAPMVFYAHKHIGSDRIMGFIYSPMNLANFNSVWIQPAQ